MLKRYDGDQVVLLDENFNIKGLNDPQVSKAKWAQLEVKSVQHTGTCFLHELLRSSGWQVRVSHYTSKVTGFVISPIRNPRDVWKTWCSRERKEDFDESWDIFNETFLENPDLHIIPIDTENREHYLSGLSRRLKCHLYTDWEPVESRPHRNYQERDLTDIYNLPVVRKFYGQYS